MYQKMELNLRHKLKDVKITIKKLKMPCKVPVTKHGNGNKDNKDSLEGRGDPSSEDISSGSSESNIVCTDDDDLEKKIQAFSIPVKKDGKLISENDKIGSDKSVTEKKGESTKTDKRVSFSLSKSDSKSKKVASAAEQPIEHTVTDTTALEAKSISKGTRSKKENLNKKTVKSNNEDKQQPSGARALTTRLHKPQDANASRRNSNTKSPLEKLRNEKNDENKKHKVIERKTRDKLGSTLERNGTGSETLRKRKAPKEETAPIPSKKPHTGKSNPQLSCKSKTSEQQKTSKNDTVVKLEPEVKRRKVPLSQNSSKVNKVSANKYLKVTRSTQFTTRAKLLKRMGSSSKEQKINRIEIRPTKMKLTVHAAQQHKSKVVAKHRESNRKNRNDSSSEKKIDESAAKQRKGQANGKKESIVKRKISNPDKETAKSGIAKELQKAPLQIDPKHSHAVHSHVTSEQVDKSNIEDQKPQENIALLEGNTVKNDCHIVDDDLFEKIYSILEDSSGKPEFSFGRKRYISQELLPLLNQQIVPPSREKKTFFKPNLLHQKPKFPSHCMGTKWYKKLWKWSDFVKMPSDMWSINKHPNGNFVVVFHISEMSPFPELLIDKCVVFEGTASPSVKIYGKNVHALSSENELQTLGNVCSFLQQIHDLSLCEGQLSQLAERNKNCELYANGNVSLPYKCKSCL